MTHTIQFSKTTDLLWLSDLHLDRVTDEDKDLFFEKLRGVHYDAALITGDISTSKQLIGHLGEISRACCERPVYFLLGNHDYFDGSIGEVDRAVIDLSRRCRNLIPLGHGEIIKLSPNTALIGHRGWYDGRAGAGAKTCVWSPDHRRIEDFKTHNRQQFFERLAELGDQSAGYFRRVLPEALRQYSKVLLATHVPVFYQGVKHSGTHCQWDRQPFYTNRAAGNAIVGITRMFPRRKVKIYAGHSHCATEFQMSGNLAIRVAGAQPGKPAFQEILRID
jgi:predicted MPP superfamily phosphohydrolase